MPNTFPSLEQILASSTDWLLGAVTTEEASALLSIPIATLETWRSRKSDGPLFVRIRNTRIIRYIRIELYRWLLADGLLEHNGAIATPVQLPTGKRVGSETAQDSTRSISLEQATEGKMDEARSGRSKPHHPGSGKRLSNSPGKPPRGGGRHGKE